MVYWMVGAVRREKLGCRGQQTGPSVGSIVDTYILGRCLPFLENGVDDYNLLYLFYFVVKDEMR